MNLNSIASFSKPLALSIRTIRFTVTVAVAASAFAPGAVLTHRHHHHSDADNETPRHHHRHHSDDDDDQSCPPRHRHHRHHESDDDDQPVRHHRHHHHYEQATEEADNTPAPAEHHIAHPENRSPLVVADTYADTAAIRLAALANRSRNLVDQRVPSAHEVHLAEQNQIMEIREVQRRERLIRIAMQDYALHYEGVVDAARSLRGTRYVFGGTSRSGFDCSGFVRYILSSRGIDLPRTAEEQFYHGVAVSKDELQPGDLVFFQNTYRHGISHVGIYVGNGDFVHAANSHEGVREDSLSESYYVNHYAGARRVEYR